MIVLKPLIVAEKISKTYLMGQVTVKALNEASFKIYANELVCILGPSGSGKSTLLNILGGMDKVSSGELFYNGFENNSDVVITEGLKEGDRVILNPQMDGLREGVKVRNNE